MTQANDVASDALRRYVKENGGSKVIQKILIANNGMAATKSMLSIRQWGYLEFGAENLFEFVAMATPQDLDANSEYIRLANTYVEVPGGKNVNNYANVDVICDVAKSHKVDAVWPGWGHASENPKLPEALKALGITFIGPTAPVMSVLGDKIAAGILAQTAGVSSIPWSGDGLQANLTEEGTIPDEIFKKGCVFTVEEAAACADRIGYPVMVKASEGGGGKGIRMCKNKAEITANFPQVQNEAPPGSPIFVMKLCHGARHIEVQIVGDMHGNAVALNGRDCSTQRRFQKIFEEGPPIIVPKDTFVEMERAAMRLCKNLGYIGAGTIEYLYQPKDNQYFFLELNPRLQVEHPVTEEIMNVNLPSIQVQVLMGIPLEKIPQIRRLYGKGINDTSGIDFLKDAYIYPTKHCLASRITAENPDDAFKPTSGKINRIKFQSSQTCWGYFAIGANGAIHEFADSQFGHIFAHGANREDARKSLMLALRNIDIVGEIRNPVEYLVELGGTDAFKQNNIDTSWLDGILREKSIGVKYNDFDVVFCAAVFRATNAFKAREDEVIDALKKGQLGPIQKVGSMNKIQIEITFVGKKYSFQVIRAGPDLLNMSLGSQKIAARVRKQPDGAMFVSVGDSVIKVKGSEEALGLRLNLEGIATVMLPTIYDPSELRSEFPGKIVRYLHDDGSAVKEGEPYIELEAMKMIMPLKATSSGTIKHTKGAGSTVSAGDLLASLELDDPSSGQTIVPFTGQLMLTALKDTSAMNTDEDIQSQVDLVLDGYARTGSATTLVQQLFNTLKDANEAAGAILERYLAVESTFAKMIKAGVQGADQQILGLIAENKDSLANVMALMQSHSQLSVRNEVVLATLRVVRWAQAGGSVSRLTSCLEKLVSLPQGGHGYDEVVLIARQASEQLSIPSFEERKGAIRCTLEAAKPDFAEISKAKTTKSGVELLLELLNDKTETVRKNALEAYVRRTHRSYSVSDLSVNDKGPSQVQCAYKYVNPGVAGTTQPRSALCAVVPNFGGIPAVLQAGLPLQKLDSAANMIEIIVGPEAFPEVTNRPQFYSTNDSLLASLPKVGEMLKTSDAGLKAAGVGYVTLTMLQAPHVPRQACFVLDSGSWKEDPNRRDMRSTVPYLLELGWLSEEYELQHIVPTIGRRSQVFLGTKKLDKNVKTRGAAPKTLHVRMVVDALTIPCGAANWTSGPETLLLTGLDESERARLRPDVGQQPNGQLFVNIMTNVELPVDKVSDAFRNLLKQFVASYGSRLQQLKVDEIVIKVGVGSPGGTRSHSLRITASSCSGEYLRIYSFFEKEDPITGKPVEWMDVRTGEPQPLDKFSESKLALKRNAARTAGSTYAPEFLGMMKIELIKRWAAHNEKVDGLIAIKPKESSFLQRQVSDSPDPLIPADVFDGRELILSKDGTISESTRAPGQNEIGMMGWRCTLRTPECPDGRDIVLIANDVTHQAGSFGVAEDIYFQKVSEYARVHGLPRIHIACNSGARVGLVEELKPYVKPKWVDEQNPSKGFEYLYLDEVDYNRFDKNVVIAKDVGGQKYAIEAIIGNGLKSTAGGIGVENLRGSGLIAGETSRAYNEIFTLSYITGRSVGIGAYLNRLAQRTIQMVNGPIILTGYGALNKLLGKSVYTSQDQLGGPQVMIPNGISHQLVQNDAEGVTAILDWLSYVPRDAGSMPPMLDTADPPEREVTFTPSKTPYDPRHMLAGTTAPDGTYLSGFFDEDSFHEYLEGWAKSVVIGRARLGGMPVGVIAVETRNVERIVPADPADDTSREVVEPQAGQVWYPDSAYKTATAIRDMNRGENLPLMIFANWRGFSGGTRDMAQAILKFGSMIVDALVEYKHPVFVYIPPGGELRGGSWVVVDPTINSDQMEMYADVDSRGGILEPPGIVEVKFREKERTDMMHRLDSELKKLDSQVDKTQLTVPSELRERIDARVEKLAPVYTQIATEFADLHDRSGRMAAQGVIRCALDWKKSREFFFWRIQRRQLENDLVKKLQAADPEMSRAAAMAKLADWFPGEDKAVVDKINFTNLEPEIKKVQVESLKRRIAALQRELASSQ
jgi:acetyl-CoA carboxylase/biotin carboxylase 1